MYLATVPTGGIAATGGTVGAPTAAPVAAGSTATLYRMSPGGSIDQLGPVTLYNVSPVDAVPASVLAVVDITSAGHYYCRSWPGQANPGAILADGRQPYQNGF